MAIVNYVNWSMGRFRIWMVRQGMQQGQLSDAELGQRANQAGVLGWLAALELDRRAELET